MRDELIAMICNRAELEEAATGPSGNSYVPEAAVHLRRCFLTMARSAALGYLQCMAILNKKLGRNPLASEVLKFLLTDVTGEAITPEQKLSINLQDLMLKCMLSDEQLVNVAPEALKLVDDAQTQQLDNDRMDVFHNIFTYMDRVAKFTTRRVFCKALQTAEPGKNFDVQLGFYRH
jgi:hypothetical protein